MSGLTGGKRWVAAAGIIAGVLAVLSVAAFAGLTLDGGPATRLSRLAVSDGFLPVSLTVFGRGSDTISARISFYDPSGNLVGMAERSWSGWELYLDCVLVGTGSGWMVFPYLAYTDETISGHGVDLVRFYDRGGLPLIHDAPGLDSRERRALRRLFWLVKTERWMPVWFGSLHHRRVSIRSFEAGVEYRLHVGRNGELRLVAD